MPKQHDKKFKVDAAQYYKDNRELRITGCFQNLGIGSSVTKA